MKANSLSKDIILLHTNCNDIYTKFLGLTDFPKNNISSPFSDDKKPSFKVYQNGTFKCNSSTKQGDVWQFVAYLNNIDVKTQFNEVLQIVVNEMNIENLLSSQNPTTVKNKSLQPNTTKIATTVATNCNNDYSITDLQPKIAPIPTNTETTTVAKDLQQNCNEVATNLQPKKLIVATRDFTNLDLEYWNNLGVSKNILDKYKVHSISSSRFHANKLFRTKDKTVSFAYEINGLFKKYTPEQPEHNEKKSLIPHLKNVVFGLEQLPAEKIKNLIICEGEKDVIIASSRGFNAVTFGSATNNPTMEQITTLQERCENLFICYDDDIDANNKNNSGKDAQNNIIKKYDFITGLNLPNKNQIKGFDVTDYFQEHTAQDFQKIIDLAVKNKNVVEVATARKYSNYEMPKEVKEPIENFIDDIENYSMFMANSRIWIMQGDVKKHYFKSVSNFEIEILQHMQDEIRPLKLVRIKNVRNMECVFDVQSNQINTLANFDTTMTNFSNFYFTGTKKDFDLMRAFLYDKMGNGRKIDSLGYQKEFNIWIWNNKVNLFNGTEIDIDKNGMFTLNENCFYIPSANQIYKNNNSRYMSQKKFKIHKSKIKINEYLKLINSVYAENSIPAILFSIASLFQDIVISETNSFPILFLQGQKSSGKDNLAFCCQSFLGTPQDKISIGAGISTPKAQIRELAQFTNGISQFSEYKTGDRITDEILKGIWDRNGYKIATIESKISSDIIPVLNSLILTSNYTPIDEALISRLIWVNIEKNSGFTDKNINDFDQLNDIAKIGVSSLSNELFIYRNDFQLQFQELYRKNKKLLTNLFGNAPVRISGNYSVLFSTFEFFSKYIEFPFTENEMKNYFIKSSDYMDNKMKTSNIVSRWWECFYECLTAPYENRIILDQDFKINTNQIIYNFTSIYGKIQRVWFNQYREHIPLKSTMQDALQKCNSFTEKKESVRIYKNPTTAYQFDLIKVPNGADINERIGTITAL